ncbi:MAG: hypothetical protein KDE19_07650 [Caldilineaceae bacterium]|nr:hypothetical protein [Caldilineaceae bacterium]
MTPSQRCCFVLWGDQCDEVAAVLFVTTLRAAGLRVWVVGVSGRRISGVHGLQLIADLALDEALPLAAQAACVIAPCAPKVLLHFLNDPRLGLFFQTSVQQAVPLLIAQSIGEIEQPNPLSTLDLPAAALIIYPAGEALLPFIRSFAATLSESLY